jgi:hypothetical protein
MIDYMVLDTLWGEYVAFESEEMARDYIKEKLDEDPAASIIDFVVYKRERLD